MSGIALAKSPFSGAPVEFQVPKSAEVIFVNDFFVSDLSGGAELTSEALIASSPVKVFRMHSGSVNQRLIDQNKDKTWVIGNFAGMKDGVLSFLPDSGLNYHLVEFDFKFCVWRSVNKHLQATGNPCDCSQGLHGMVVKRLFENARTVFWMSEKQKEYWEKHSGSSFVPEKQVVLGSVFDPETIQFLTSLRDSEPVRSKSWGVLGSGSWIKGIEETKSWCELNRKEFEPIPNLPYKEFLKKLNTFQGLIFRPLDFDTCPRLVIEAKVMGLNLLMNHNVLHQQEEWFQNTSSEEVINHLRLLPQKFWKQVLPQKF